MIVSERLSYMKNDDEEDWASVNPMTLFSTKEEEELLRALQFARESGYHKNSTVDVVISMLESSIACERGG